jgi:hypothetical protein
MAKYPLRLTPTVRSHSSSVKRQRSLLCPAVALLITMSILPNTSTAVAMIPAAPSHVAEPVFATAVPPSDSISATTLAASAPARVPRSLTTTLAPWAASSRAWARPMPPPAPVTMATLPTSRRVIAPPQWFVFWVGPGAVAARSWPPLVVNETGVLAASHTADLHREWCDRVEIGDELISFHELFG